MNNVLLRISAVLAIIIGLALAIETWTGMSNAYRFPVEGEGTYIVEHFALQWAFVASLIVGGGLALWREWNTLLAAAWGIVVGLEAPHLIRPPVPAAIVNQMAQGHTYVVKADVGQYVVVGLALLGLVLCGVAEWQRASRSKIA